MLIRGWELSRLFQDEESGAGESAAAGTAVETVASPAAELQESDVEPEPDQPDHAANVEFVKQWSKTSDDATVTATATTTEPVKETPVGETSTDAVRDDDAAASSGKEQDELLLSLAEAYDFTREELKGISNEGLTSLIAREKRRQGPLETKADETETTTTETAAADPQKVTFDEVAQAIRDDLIEQGHGDDSIQRQLQIAKLNWDRQEALITDARQAREETQWVRQTFEQDRRQRFEDAERQGFFDVVAKVAAVEKGLLPQPGTTNAPADQVENLNRWWQAFNDVKRVRRDVQELAKTNLPAARAKAVNIAFSIAFPEVVAKRGQLTYAKKILAQADKVMGSPRSAKAPDTGSFNGNFSDDPKIVRHWNKMLANRT